MNQEDIQKALEAISKSGISVKGDLVLEKHVEYEVNNVEEGGIGIQINNGNEAKNIALTDPDKEIKVAIEELLKEKNDKEEFVFKNKKQWWALFRVLSTYRNYPLHKTAFVTKIKNLKVEGIDAERDLTYESLIKAQDSVPKIATCDPSAWSEYKDINDNYKQQYVVAEFLMLKLGIKS